MVTPPLRVALVSSLTPLTAQGLDAAVAAGNVSRLFTWGGEEARVLLAWHAGGPRRETNLEVSLSAPGTRLAVERAEIVPLSLPYWREEGEAREGFALHEPCLHPDPLVMAAEGPDEVTAWDSTRHLGWHVMHLRITPTRRETTVRIALRVRDQWDNAEVEGHEFDLEVVSERADAAYAEGPLFSQWIHVDSIAHAHGLEVWSEPHWDAVESYLCSAAGMGVTGTIVPVWTPPLDTAQGTYRTRVQLAEISRTDEGYEVSLERVRRFLTLMRAAGMRHVETPPLFTQWGASHAAPLYVDDSDSPTFGWHTDARDPDFMALIHTVLGQTLALVAREFPEFEVFAHISDEPGGWALEQYRAVARALKQAHPRVRTLDALSDVDFASHVDAPVVATDAASRWIESGVRPSWVYHCSAQSRDVANRFLAQEPLRIRGLGAQMFLEGASGFLHWGFNFCGAELSRGWVDPWLDTSTRGAFPSGDACIVYPPRTLPRAVHGPAPREGGEASAPCSPDPVPSLRYHLVREAMRDYALLSAASRDLGEDAVRALIDPDAAWTYADGWPAAPDFERRIEDVIHAWARSSQR